MIEAMKPIAWIKIRELSYMQAVAEQGAAEWKTNLGLKPEPDDEGLYTETQVQKMWESFEQSVTDPENQPSQYGTVPMKEWVWLTEEEKKHLIFNAKITEPNDEPIKFGQPSRKCLQDLVDAIESKLKEKNT